jgi:hypothetical protein
VRTGDDSTKARTYRALDLFVVWALLAVLKPWGRIRAATDEARPSDVRQGPGAKSPMLDSGAVRRDITRFAWGMRRDRRDICRLAQLTSSGRHRRRRRGWTACRASRMIG